ncbi:MAG TPA: arsenate reductase (glutaredoxin) [Rhodobacteraceae bacterium]|nr:arsenate reductase (glutaredoxin) [Paracoccaceae bacterium]
MSVIWHNPRCSKSRATLALIEQAGINPEIRLYLNDAPSQTEIGEALGLLGIPAKDLVRKTDALFKELGLKGADEQTLIKAMSENPKLIERPIVFANNKAAIGRPPESVLSIL